MENNHPVNDLMASTIQKIRETVDAIQAGEVTLIPVSKISFGFGTGGTEFPGKNAAPGKDGPFGGGGGAGVKVTPVCFLVVSGTNVRVLPMNPPAENSVDRVVEMIPEVVTKITEFIDKKKDKSENKD